MSNIFENDKEKDSKKKCGENCLCKKFADKVAGATSEEEKEDLLEHKPDCGCGGNCHSSSM